MGKLPIGYEKRMVFGQSVLMEKDKSSAGFTMKRGAYQHTW